MNSSKYADLLAAELSHLAQLGIVPLTLGGMQRKLAALGYKLEPGTRITCLARYVSGERAGVQYPSASQCIIEADTNVSAFHYRDARRDANFAELQRLRMSGELCAVVRGCIIAP